MPNPRSNLKKDPDKWKTGAAKIIEDLQKKTGRDQKKNTT